MRGRSQPAPAPEVVRHAPEQDDHRGQDLPERGGVLLARHTDVHAPDARHEREREDDDRDRGQYPERLVGAMGDLRLVGGLERLYDFLVVLEHVPDALGRVVDVVEVDVEVVRHVARLVALEVGDGGPLRADDLAEVDDLLLDVGDVAHDLGRVVALEDPLLDPLELVADLAQHRERGVDALVDDLVEQVAWPLGEQRLALLLVRPAALEQVLDRLQGLVRDRDQVVGADEQVELGGVEAADLLVVAREVQDDEQVLVVLVDLRTLVARDDVLVVERVELEALLQPREVDRARALDVDPAQAEGLDDLDVRLVGGGYDLRRAATRATPERRVREARHN